MNKFFNIENKIKGTDRILPRLISLDIAIYIKKKITKKINVRNRDLTNA